MLNRCFILFIALCLLAIGCLFSASAQSVRDPLLQAAFENNALVLREKQFMSDLSGYTLRIPAAYYQQTFRARTEGITPKYSEDGVWVSLALADQGLFSAPKPYFFSPDGNKAILMDEEYAYVLEGKTITLITYNQERSVPDEYGKYEIFSKMKPAQWAGSEGIAWSPDSRYAVLTNYVESLINARFVYGLYIIDTYSGELYCADTYPIKLRDGGAVVFQACFDAAGRYVYYMLWGSLYEDSRVSLMRYDMQTGERQRLLACPRLAAYPKLQRDSKGRLVNLLDSLRGNESAGLSVFEKKEGKWAYVPFELSQPGSIVHPNYMEIGSADMGVLLHWIRFLDKTFTMAGRFFADDSLTGHDELLIIEGDDVPQATVLPLSDYGDGTELAERIASGEVLQCLNIRISPDGRYALLFMLKSQERTLSFLMMDMETLALRRVQTPPKAASMGATNSTALSQAYPCGYSWFEGNKVVMLTEDGLKLYEFAY